MGYSDNFNPIFESASFRSLIIPLAPFQIAYKYQGIITVLRIRIREPVRTFWPLDPGLGLEKNPDPGSGIRDENPGSYFWKPGFRIRIDLMRIRIRIQQFF